MSPSNKKWFYIFIYLAVSIPFGLFITSLASLFLIGHVTSLIYGTHFDFLSYDFFKILKASIGGGMVAAIGCWFIYYKNHQ
jgi:hypothetical protein